jgi:hypothetical protein
MRLLIAWIVLCASLTAQVAIGPNVKISSNAAGIAACAAGQYETADTATGPTCALPPVNVHAISFTFGDPAGSALTSGTTTTQYVTVPFACTLSAWNILVDAGTLTFKTWKVATGTAIPTVTNSINTSGVSIASGTAIHSTTMTDFTTTAVAANNIMAVNITAVATAKYANIVLECDQ